jgi:hypothetical protein
MGTRADIPLNLLLASAVLRKLPDINRRAPLFEAAWQAARMGEVETVSAVPMDAAKRLLRTALGLCEATGIDRADLTAFYNDRRDAGDFAIATDLDQLVTEMAKELLAIMGATNAHAQ